MRRQSSTPKAPPKRGGSFTQSTKVASTKAAATTKPATVQPTPKATQSQQPLTPQSETPKGVEKATAPVRPPSASSEKPLASRPSSQVGATRGAAAATKPAAATATKPAAKKASRTKTSVPSLEALLTLDASALRVVQGVALKSALDLGTLSKLRSALETMGQGEPGEGDTTHWPGHGVAFNGELCRAETGTSGLLCAQPSQAYVAYSALVPSVECVPLVTRAQGNFSANKLSGPTCSLEFSTGQAYSGPMEAGIMSGTGSLKAWDGRVSIQGTRVNSTSALTGSVRIAGDTVTFDGQYSGAGARSGRGKLEAAAMGLHYDGDWSNGSYQGKGALSVCNTTSSYSGLFDDGRRHGAKGEEIIGGADVFTYSGAFSKGLRSGSGTAKWGPQGEEAMYTGEWAEGLQHGKGRLTLLESGTTYTGAWHRGVRSGVGAQLGKSGDGYEGMWQDDVRHGNGKLIAGSSTTFGVHFSHGVLDGEFSVLAEGKEVFRGEWCGNGLNGRAQFVLPSGTFRGTWEKPPQALLTPSELEAVSASKLVKLEQLAKRAASASGKNQLAEAMADLSLAIVDAETHLCAVGQHLMPLFTQSEAASQMGEHVAAMQDEIKRLKSTNDKVGTSQRNLDQTVSSLKSQVAKAETALADAQALLEKETKAKDAAVEASNKQLGSDVSLADLEAQLKAENASVKELSQAVDDVKDRVKTQKANKAKADKEHKELKKDLDEISSHTTVCDDTTSSARDKVAEQAAEYEELVRQAQAMLERAQATHAERLARLQDAEVELVAEREAVDTANDTTKRLAAQHTELVKKVASFDADIIAKARELEVACTEVTDLDEELSRQRDNDLRYTQSHKDFQMKLMHTQDDINSAKVRQELQQQEHRDAVEEYMRGVRQSRGEFDDTAAEAQLTEEMEKRRREKTKRHMNSLNAYELELEMARGEVRTESARVASLQKELDELREIANAPRTPTAPSKPKPDSAEDKERQKLQRQLEMAREESDAFQAQIRTLNERLDEASAQRRQLRKEVAALAKQSESHATSQIQGDPSTLEGLKAQLASAKSLIEQRESQNAALKVAVAAASKRVDDLKRDTDATLHNTLSHKGLPMSPGNTPSKKMALATGANDWRLTHLHGIIESKDAHIAELRLEAAKIPLLDEKLAMANDTMAALSKTSEEQSGLSRRNSDMFGGGGSSASSFRRENSGLLAPPRGNRRAPMYD